MKRLKRFKTLLVPILFLILIVFFTAGVDFIPVEEIDIISGIGYDIEGDPDSDFKYNISISRDIFQEDKIITQVISGKARSILGTRQDRQRRSNKEFLLGLEQVTMASEKFARYSIRNLINTVFSNPHVNDKTWMIICKGKAVDILKFKIEGYPSSADYIEGLIENAKNYNFFPDNYKLVDIYVRVDEEGRNLSVPYIEIVKDNIEITGMALFKNDKMTAKIDLGDARIMSILKEKHSHGILTVQKNPREYVDYMAHVNSKTKCTKVDDKFKFTIDLDFEGDVIGNELYEDLLGNLEDNKKFEKDMKAKIEKMCYGFIEKMQKDYKVDCLELGRVAAAKYGRNTGVDWNEIVSDSDIKVNVKVTIDRYGRGDF